MVPGSTQPARKSGLVREKLKNKWRKLGVRSLIHTVRGGVRHSKEKSGRGAEKRR